jgi:hypothetical protein
MRPTRRLRSLSILALGVAIASTTESADPTVANVRARQLDGSTQVEVLYDLTDVPPSGATVSIAFSATGEAPYDVVPAFAALEGDIGAGVLAGHDRRILWNAAATLPASTVGTTYQAAVTALDPGAGSSDTIAIALPGGENLVLTHVPAGRFMMGSLGSERGRYGNEDPHFVTLTRGYYIGTHEVTQGQWAAVFGNNPATGSEHGVGPDHPVYFVTWYDAAAFTNELSRLAGLEACYELTDCSGSPGDQLQCESVAAIGPTCAGFRLPTEAEWERAARAGTQTRFSYGDALECGDEDEFCELHAGSSERSTPTSARRSWCDRPVSSHRW